MATLEVQTTTEVQTTVAVDQAAAEKNTAAVLKSKASNKSSVLRKPSTHLPFYKMVSDAIVTLNEKTGSSQYAIAKFTEEKHKQLPSNFRKLLLVQLKRLVASGKLLKIENSYKLPVSKVVKKVAPKKAAIVSKVSGVKSKSVAKLKPKSKAVAKPKGASVGVKRKAAGKIASPKPVKAAKTSTAAVPGKKVPAVKKGAAVPAKKKVASKAKVPTAKKPKSVKSPVKKTSTRKVSSVVPNVNRKKLSANVIPYYQACTYTVCGFEYSFHRPDHYECAGFYSTFFRCRYPLGVSLQFDQLWWAEWL